MDDFVNKLQLDLFLSAKHGTSLPTMNANELAPVMGTLSRRSERECVLIRSSTLVLFAVFKNPSTAHKVFAYKDPEECASVCDKFEGTYAIYS
jgi:hypothetical protein